MSLRFKIVGTAAAIVLLLASQGEGLEMLQSVHGFLAALGLLLAFAVFAFWPDARVDREDRGLGRGAWTTRIDFDRIRAEARERQS